MKVTFQFESGSTAAIGCTPGENLLEAARRAGVSIDAPCSGNGSCGKCRVRLLEGTLEGGKSRHITPEEFAAGWRLSCESKVIGECTILVPGAQLSGMKITDLSNPREMEIFAQCQTRLKKNGISFANRFQSLVITMPPPDLDDTMPDSERFSRAVREGFGAAEVRIPYAVMTKLAAVLRTHGFRVCVKGAWQEDTFCCMDVCAPENSAMVCCAVDIGTTTVSALLADLSTGKVLSKGSSGNAQIRYGADVINRIMEQGKPGGIRRLRDAVIHETLNPILKNLCKDAGISQQSILRIAVAANTTMNHLFLGVDAQSVRMEPYIPSFFFWEGVCAGDLNLCANPMAPVRIAPNIGSYVGGDITAGTLALGIWNQEQMHLLIDLGTNGELVLGNRDFLISCACSAGPAFEGGDISCGMRAMDGAAEAVRIDRDTMEPVLSVIGAPEKKCTGICGSGLIDLISELFRCGIINPRGQFIREGRRVKRDDYGCGRYVLAFPSESGNGREIAVDEVDIDNFIRAKGAVYSAMDTLLHSVDMDAEALSKIYVAGGIGSGINMRSAVNIGMFPNVPQEKFFYMGNSSLAGAYALAVSDGAWKTCAEVAANMTYLELSTTPGYMDNFVAACFLPHTDRSRFRDILPEQGI